MLYLNIGCGSRFHPDWVNLDLKSNTPFIRAADISRGIPYPDQTFSVVYHSHLLEHLQKQEAFSFIQDCYRVLKPGGVIRIAVPDLEQIARSYLSVLEKSLEKQYDFQFDYDWMMLELYDQTVREFSGGDMLRYLRKNLVPNLDFVYKRIGGEAKKIVNATQTNLIIKKRNETDLQKIIEIFRHLQSHAKEKLLRAILGSQDYKALKVGRFRLSGEVHRWMYDRFSLQRLLEEVGFVQVTKQDADRSLISNWTSFNLDTEPDGSVYKPESLFMEAVKPSR